MTRARSFLVWLGVIIWVVAAYWPGVHGDFVFDDHKLVVQNDQLWNGSGFDLRIWRDRSGDPVRTNFRPVRFISYELDALLSRWLRTAPPDGPADPFFFHLQNILLHAINTLLVGLIAARLLPRDWRMAAPAVALAFALHPVNIESVEYISGRRDVLFLTFYLLAILCYLRWRPAVGWGRGAVLALLFLLALGSKEMAVSLPIALVAVELLVRPRGERTRLPWKALVPMAVVGGAYVAVLLLRADPGRGAAYWGGSPWTALWTSLRAQVYYLRLLVWPSPLTVDYSYDAFPVSHGPFAPVTGILSLLFLASLLAIAVWAGKRSRWLLLGVPLYFVFIAPVAQILPHPERMAEHFLYLPSLAFLAVAGAMVAPLARRAPVPFFAAVSVVLCVWTFQIQGRLQDWAGPYPLWRSATQAFPRCARAQVGLGDAANHLGRKSEAVRALGRAIEILPEKNRDPLQQGYYLRARALRGSILSGSSVRTDLDAARHDLEALLAEKDTDGRSVGDDPAVLLDLLKVYERLGLRDDGVRTASHLLEVATTAPLRLEALLYLAGASAEKGKQAETEKFLERAEKVCTNDRQRGRVAYQRGTQLFAKERWDDARAAFSRAAELVGSTGRWESARFQEAQCLNHLGRVDDAIVALREIVAAQPDHLPALLSLAQLLSAKGSFGEAVKLFQSVLARAPENAVARRGLAEIAVKRKFSKPAAAPSAGPSRTLVLTMLAKRLLREGKPEKAVDALRDADKAAEGPDQLKSRIEIRLLLARTLARLGKWDDAATAYRSYLDVAPVDARGDAALEAAEVERRRHRTAAAYDLLAGQWRAGVRHPGITKNLGGLALMQGKKTEAAHWYRLYLDQKDLPEGDRRSVEKVLAGLGTKAQK